MTSVDPERDAHLLEIGRAITEWAAIQDQLYSIVLTVLRCAPRHAAIVFFRTPSIESRITLTDDLLKTVFPQTSEKPGSKPHPGYVVWMNIQADLRDETPIRNSLAHHPVDLVIDVWEHKTTGELSFSGTRPATMMSLSETLRKGSRQPLTIEDIEAHIARVSAFAPRLLEFRSGPLAAQLLAPA
jgi:hypothetical protein